MKLIMGILFNNGNDLYSQACNFYQNLSLVLVSSAELWGRMRGYETKVLKFKTEGNREAAQQWMELISTCVQLERTSQRSC